jgi:hypothetical protein
MQIAGIFHPLVYPTSQGSATMPEFDYPEKKFCEAKGKSWGSRGSWRNWRLKLARQACWMFGYELDEAKLFLHYAI